MLRTLLFGFAFWATTASGASAAPQLQVSSAVQVRSAHLKLGDVARLSGLSPAERERLAAIDLGPAPAVGTGRLLPRAFLRSTLEAAGLPVGMVLRLPERLEVTRASAVLESSAQRDAVEAAVRSHLGQVDTLASVKVPSLPDLQVPAGATLGISVDRAPKGGRTVSTTLRVLDGQVAIRTQQVVVQIDPLTQTWVLRGDIGRGQPVTSGDLVSVMRPASEQPADAIRDPAELIAATARRDLTGGEPLVRRAVEVQPMVARGQRVTMVAIGRGIRVSAVGEALAAGRQGDTIRIKNLDSNKVVTGRVSGPQTVQMEL